MQDPLKNVILSDTAYDKYKLKRRKGRSPFVLHGGMTIGLRLRELRTKYSLTVREAAELADVRIPIYMKIERATPEDASRMKLITLAKYCEAVGGKLRIAIVPAGAPRRVESRAKLNAWRDARRPNPKTAAGAHIQAVSKRRSPRKLVLRPRYPG